jgi:hypothetical protein
VSPLPDDPSLKKRPVVFYHICIADSMGVQNFYDFVAERNGRWSGMRIRCVILEGGGQNKTADLGEVGGL